jgi:hypothetical protein
LALGLVEPHPPLLLLLLEALRQDISISKTRTFPRFF